LNLAIGARMHETTLTATTSTMVLNEIQRIDVNANVVSERQVEFIIYLIKRCVVKSLSD
jgi:hypothetical protein